MTREWKPGDVAMVTCSNHPDPFIAIRHSSDWRGWPLSVTTPTSIRPLVVINPKNAVQVERLLKLMGDYVSTADALREYADPTPPKPPEPTGLGAVVEDADGVRWVRFTAKTGSWWRNHEGRQLRYADITAVRVLSHGVPA